MAKGTAELQLQVAMDRQYEWHCPLWSYVGLVQHAASRVILWSIWRRSDDILELIQHRVTPDERMKAPRVIDTGVTDVTTARAVMEGILSIETDYSYETIVMGEDNG